MVGNVTPTPPLIVRSDDGILLFSSVGAAQGWLEVPDVEAGVYGPAFDAEGRLMSVQPPSPLFEDRPVTGWRRLTSWLGPQFNAVELNVAEAEPGHVQELKDLLREALGAVALNTNDLDGLVALAIERFGMT